MSALSGAQRRQADTEQRADRAEERLAQAEAELLVACQNLEEKRVRSASLQSEVIRLGTVDAKAESLTLQLEQHREEMAELRVSVHIARSKAQAANSKAQAANEQLREGLDQARRQEALAVEFFKSSPEYYAALEARAQAAMEMGYRDCFRRVSAEVPEADLSQASFDVLAAEEGEDEEDEEADEVGPGASVGATEAAAGAAPAA